MTAGLDPSIDPSLAHNLAGQYLKGVPTYLDQPDVRKLIQDHKQHMNTSVNKIIELQETAQAPYSKTVKQNRGPRLGLKRRLRSAKQGIREISREYVENAMI